MAALSRGNQRRILLGRVHVVHRAGPDDHQQPVIAGVQDCLDALAGQLHGAGCLLADRQLGVQNRRRHQGPGFHHVEVGGGNHAAKLADGPDRSAYAAIASPSPRPAARAI